MFFIGLDVGTTGAKAIIVNDEGKVLAQSYQEYPTETPARGQFELNPEVVWQAVKEIIQSSVKQAKLSSDVDIGISVSSLGEAVVLLDRNDQILGNSLLYLDSRGSKQLNQLVDKLGEERIIQSTGVKPHAMFTLPKLMWHKEENNDIYKQTNLMLSFSSFILYQLGSKPMMDYSLASRTMAFDIWKLKWDEELIATAGIDKKIFPEVAPPGTFAGMIDPVIANELGLPYDVKLVLGAHDQVCAAIGAGISEKHSAAYGMGTVHCITPVFSDRIDVQKMSKYNFCTVPYLNGNYTTYAVNFTGGSLLKWFRDEIALLETKEANLMNQNVYEILNQKVSEEPTDILVLPHFSGSGTPFMNPDSKGAFVGLDFNTSRSDIYRSLMEGIAYEMKYNLECLKEVNIQINELRASGGGAKSDLWLQIAADVLNKKVVGLDINEASVLGAILLASVALGTYSSVKEASERIINVNKVFYPQKKYQQKYEANYQKFKKLYCAINSVIKI